MFTEDEDEDQEQGKKNQGPITPKGWEKKEGFETEKHKDLFRCRGKERTWARLSCITNLQLKLIPSLGAAE